MVTIVIKSASGPKCARKPYYTLSKTSVENLISLDFVDYVTFFRQLWFFEDCIGKTFEDGLNYLWPHCY